MRVSNASRGDGATHCRSQPANVERMLDKFCGASAYQIYREPQIVFATQNHDGEAKLAMTDFFDQRPDSDTWKIHWRDDAAACAGAELGSQLLCTIEGANVDLIGRQGLRDPAPLFRQGRNDVDGVAQWPLGNVGARFCRRARTASGPVSMSATTSSASRMCAPQRIGNKWNHVKARDPRKNICPAGAQSVR